MSTPAAIVVKEKGKYYGFYVHWDGYPEAMLPILRKVLKKYGYGKMKEVLFKYKEFSSIGTNLIAVPLGDKTAIPKKDRNKWIYHDKSNRFLFEKSDFEKIANGSYHSLSYIDFLYFVHSNGHIDSYEVVEEKPQEYILKKI